MRTVACGSENNLSKQILPIGFDAHEIGTTRAAEEEGIGTAAAAFLLVEAFTPAGRFARKAIGI